MDPIGTVITCLSILQKIYDIREQLKGNYSDCGDLLTFCETFQPFLDNVKANPDLFSASSEHAYKTLLNNLKETVEFARTFCDYTIYRRFRRFAFKNWSTEQIASLKSKLRDSATVLGVVQDFDFAVQRRNEMKKMQEMLDLLTHQRQTPIREAQRAELVRRHVIPIAKLQWNTNCVLGEGAFGVVYKGTYCVTHGVAIKLIPISHVSPDISEQHIRNIENEAILLKEVEYPAVLRCYGFTRDPTNLIIVTEIAPLGSLEKLVYDTTLPFPTEAKIGWLVDISDAIDFVHSKGIKHGDIKAENFLVFHLFRLKLCDFGQARESESSLHGTSCGTPGFVAPEISHGAAGGYPSDIYSFSMTTVQVLVGRRPQTSSPEQQVEAAVASLKTLPLGQKKDLMTLLKNCCYFDPARGKESSALRPSAQQVREELTKIAQAIGGEEWYNLPIMRKLQFRLEQKVRGPMDSSNDASEGDDIKLSSQIMTVGTATAATTKIDELLKNLVNTTSQDKVEKEVKRQSDPSEPVLLAITDGRPTALDEEVEVRSCLWHTLHFFGFAGGSRRGLVPSVDPDSQASSQPASSFLGVQPKSCVYTAAMCDNSAMLIGMQFLGADIVNELHSFQPIGWPCAARVCALAIASFNGHYGVVDSLLLSSAHVSVDARDKEAGWTALMFAASKGHDTILVKLLDNNATSRQNEYGWTPLMLACANGHVSSAEILLKHGRGVELKRELKAVLEHERDIQEHQDGWTALMLAAFFDHAPVVQLLLNWSCSTSRCSKTGKTAHGLTRSRIIKKMLEAVHTSSRFVVRINGEYILGS